MLQQIADRHRRAIGATPVLEERGDAIVESQTSRSDQLHHDRRGRQNLGERGQVEGRVDGSRGELIGRQRADRVLPQRAGGRSHVNGGGGEGPGGNRALQHPARAVE